MTHQTSNVRAIAGVLPVVQMPYHDDESIDYDTLAREADWLYAHGADGLVVAMVSEVLRLTERERRDVGDFLVRHAGGRRGIITSVGAESSYLACELTRAAEQTGVDAVMAVPPIAIAADECEIRRYYERITLATSLPVIVQDASGYVGKPMSITIQARLLCDLGSRIYFKPEAAPIGPRLTALREATDGQARIFEGTGGLALVDSHRRGIVGTMPGADIPWAIRALWDALEVNDVESVNRISPPLMALIGMQNCLDAFLAIEKHLLIKQGVFRNAIVRGPVGYQLDEPTRMEVDRLFNLLQQAVGQLA
ncbi:dihydrodipicolinate synthase family protein [Phycisphaerales bacterium AB-hyl4]|uniref:Dihydrodipicolinate synthase family protein n=1 Tax=Natronomicrosphaera hydrolytica TaxID=3242702 RepID=A0ABV4U8E1_9BACT